MPYNSWVDICWLMAEQYDTRSNVKLGGFQSQLEASYVSSYTEELWYNEIVCEWQICIYRYIYIWIQACVWYICVCVYVCASICLYISMGTP